MAQVIDRLLKVGVFQHPNHNIAVATKAVAYLMGIVLVVCDKLHIVSSTDRTVGSALKSFDLRLRQFVAVAKQGVSTGLRAVVTTMAFCPTNRRGLGFGSAQGRSLFGSPFSVRLAFIALVVPSVLRVWHGNLMYRAFYTASYPRFSQALNTSASTA